ncbi:carboxypeptidase M32 [Ignavibacteria bacterium]|nr:carboxypeptidase M32 [Bacteroidota bacterium]MCZ2133372.1 carboxypeptidase M32 [Bacteroidota bacterium]
MPTSLEILHGEVISHMNTIQDVRAASSILNWDQETYMPEGAAEVRAEQIGTLDTIAHQLLTGNKALKFADAIRSFDGAAHKMPLLGIFLEDHERAVKLPEDLVRRTSKAQSLAHHVWLRARAESNYAVFMPALQELLDLKIEAAELYGYEANRYDALLNLWEPGVSVEQLNPVFDKLQAATKQILENIAPYSDRVSTVPMTRFYSKDKQLEFSRFISERLGFNFANGRIDLSAHPFCTSFSQFDVRLTTRVNENNLDSCLYGVIHETGHGLYEQGFAPELARTFGADGASMGIHESQSLFWETIITRTEEFWTFAMPHFEKIFGKTPYTPRDFYKATNAVTPSLIRVEADEITYNMHIILRYEIERDMVNRTIDLKDIPEVWNEKTRQNLGIIPPSDSQGCLQDIHWSFGGFGYFPSYTLGKLYAAMMWRVMQADIPFVRDYIRNGEFVPVLEWLRERVHKYGRTLKPGELIRRLTGRDLNAQDFVDYAYAKTADVYET